MNRWTGCGWLTDEPEVRYSQSGKAYAKFTLAIKDPFGKGDEATDYIDCTVFAQRAELIQKYTSKGTRLLVTGRLKSEKYTAKDGHTVYSKNVKVDEIEFVEFKAERSGCNAEEQKEQKEQKQNETDADGFMNIPDGTQEELPFA